MEGMVRDHVIQQCLHWQRCTLGLAYCTERRNANTGGAADGSSSSGSEQLVGHRPFGFAYR